MADCALITCYNGKGELLLGKRRDNGKWTLPGGHLENGEEPRDGAIRELKEETGLDPESLSYLTEYTLSSGMKLSCFSAFVVGEPHSNLDPDDEVEEWKFFEIDDLPAKLHGPEDFNENLLNKLFRLSREVKKSEESLKKMAVGDIAPGQHTSTDHKGVQHFDYSHVLTPEHRAAGYALTVEQAPPSHGHRFTAQLSHNSEPDVGLVDLVGLPNRPGAVQPHSDLAPEHRGKGLGTAMYEAAYKHAQTQGITHVVGGQHTEASGRVHAALARKHGLEYQATPIDQGTYRGRAVTIRSPYEYAIKGELQKKMPGYNPDHVLTSTGEAAVAHWQGNESPREYVPRMDGPERTRGLHRLVGKTPTKLVNGERHYLMHRAMSPEEGAASIGPTHVKHSAKSSWTPFTDAPPGEMYSILHHFQREYGGPIASAWIPESKIHAMLPMFGAAHPNAVENEEWSRSDPPHGYEPEDYRHTKTRGPAYQAKHWEVIVDPHESPRASEPEVKDAFASDDARLDTRINRRADRNIPALSTAGSEALRQYVHKAEDEVFRLLDHPDTSERTMALRLGSVTPRHLQAASLDPDPTVHLAAIHHPRFDIHSGLHLLEAQKGKDGLYPLSQQLSFLEKPEGVNEFHVGAAIKAGDNAPPDMVDKLHAAIVAHPMLSPGYAREIYENPTVSYGNRLTLMKHPALPHDVLQGAVHGATLVPAVETQELAKLALQHPNAASLVEDTVRQGMASRLPHVRKLAEHALATGHVDSRLIDELLANVRLSPTEHNVELVGAALRGPSATEGHLNELLKQRDPATLKHALGARGLQPRHLETINQILAGGSLAKAVDPKEFKSIAKALDPAGKDTVDHHNHLHEHPPSIAPEVEAYRDQVVDSSHPVKKLKVTKIPGRDITQKVIYHAETPGPHTTMSKFMVKPYHERVITRVKNWMEHPIQGWAEMANQALYHAGGIGHLHQKVHVSEHNMGPGHEHEPALVVHMERGLKPQMRAPRLTGDPFEHKYDEEAPPPESPHQDARKIAMMDFLTNNLDRHGGNLMQSEDGKSLRAIDHSRSFQYVSPRKEDVKWLPKSKKPRELNDRFGDYHEASSVEQASPMFPERLWNGPPGYPEERKQAGLDAYRPVFDWWNKASPKIRTEMNHQLESIKDPAVRAHVKRNFEARADWLDERSDMGIENYGTNWHNDEVPMYRMGELTDEEKQQIEKKRAVELYEKEQAERAAKYPGVSKALDNLKNYIKLNR